MPGFNSTRTYINSQKLKNAPAGHSIPTAPIVIGTPQLEEQESMSFTESSYANADAATGFDALLAAVDTAVQNFITSTLGIDIAAKTVDYNAEVIAVTSPDSIFIAQANKSYIVTMNIDIVIS